MQLNIVTNIYFIPTLLENKSMELAMFKNIFPLIVFLAVTLFSNMAISQQVKVTSWFGIGSLLTIDNVKYRMNSASDADLGAYGTITGIGWNGRKTRFNRNGYKKTVETYKARAVSLTKNTWGTLVAKSDIDLSKIQANVSSNIKTGKKTVATLFAVSLKNPDDLLAQFAEKYFSDKTDFKTKLFRKRFKSKYFRVIDTVIYATNFTVKKNNSFDVDIEITPNDGTPTQIKIDAGAENEIILQGEQIVAYSYSKICWYDNFPVSFRDHPDLIDEKCPKE